MGFISTKASKIAAAGSSGPGGYMTASKLEDGESYRIAILSEEPLEYYTVWGETDDGQKKPFRFEDEPTADQITNELGDYKQRKNYKGDQLEKPKFAIAFFCFDYEDFKVKVFEISQKTLIRELDSISKQEDYANLQEWDMVISRTGISLDTEYKILPAPRKKGMEEKVQASWGAVQVLGYDINQLMVGGSPFGSELKPD